jgi:transposase/uncharacterized protein (UPF0335 family)
MGKRFVGIDLAITSKHQASVFDLSKNDFVGKSFLIDRSIEGFELLLAKALDGTEKAPPGELYFVMEPTSLTWVPLSTFLILKGHPVYLVKPQKAAALRKFLKRHTKTNRIDSQTLAKIPLVDMASLNQLYLPPTKVEALNRHCRQRERLVSENSGTKSRIGAILTGLNPEVLSLFSDDKFTQLGRAFLRNLVDPFKIVDLGEEELAHFLEENSFGSPPPNLAKEIYRVSVSATRIYQEAKEQGRMPLDFIQIQDEINTELDILEFKEEKIAHLDKEIASLYGELDPKGELMSLPGFGEVIAPSFLGAIKDIGRFKNIRSIKCFCGFIPKKSASGDHERLGLPITKAAQKSLKKNLYLAGETARKTDPEAAAFYHRLIARGLHHNQAVCAVGGKLTGKAYALMKRMFAQPACEESQDSISYVFKDLDGHQIDKKAARELIRAKFPSKKEREKRASKKEESPSLKDLARQSLNSSKSQR